MRRRLLAIKTRLQTGVKKPVATTTVHQCRGGLFFPVKEFSRHFQGIDKPFENQWGRITPKKCRLTQTHQNILESIIVCSERVRKLPDGRIAFLYSPARILRFMGVSSKNHAWLYDKLSDLLTTEIEVEAATFRASGTLLFEKSESKVSIPGRSLPSGKGDGSRIEPRYQLVVFHPFFSRLFDVDVALHYQLLLPEILELEHAVTQAVVRFCLSHDALNMALTNVLTALGSISSVTPERTCRRIVKHIRDEATALKNNFGIDIRKMEDGRNGIFYRKHPKVWFESPEGPVTTASREMESLGIEEGRENDHGLIPGMDKAAMV